MASAFNIAVEHLFADPNLSRAAVYKTEGAAPAQVRVIARRADQVMDFGDTRIQTGNLAFDIPVSQIGQPVDGDIIELEDEAFVVQGEPVRDQERLVWTLDVRPA